VVHAAQPRSARLGPFASLIAALTAAPLLACGSSTTDRDPRTVVAGQVLELPSPAVSGSGQPFLARARDGAVLMSWLERAGDTTRAHALRFARWDGESWSEPRTIATSDAFFVNWADFPSIAELPDGRLAAHWLARSGSGRYAYDVRIAWSGDGGLTWSDPVTPHTDGTPTEHGFVSMFPLDGGIGAAWLDGRNFAGRQEGADDHGPGADMTLRVARIAQDGTLSHEHEIDGRTCECCQTDAALAAGGPILVYRDRSPAEVRDIALVRFDGGRWTDPAIVHADGWVFPGCPVNGPAVAGAGDRVGVAWYTAAGERPRVRLAVSEDGGRSFGPPIDVDDGAPAGRADLLFLDDGTALVSWIEGAGDNAGVRIRAVSPRSGAGPSATVAAASAERASGFPRMLATEAGVLFAWTDPGRAPRVRIALVTLERTAP
jgi:hypothetical protein